MVIPHKADSAAAKKPDPLATTQDGKEMHTFVISTIPPPIPESHIPPLPQVTTASFASVAAVAAASPPGKPVFGSTTGLGIRPTPSTLTPTTTPESSSKLSCSHSAAVSGAPASSDSHSLSLDQAIHEMKSHPKGEALHYAKKTSQNSPTYNLRKKKVLEMFVKSLEGNPRFEQFLQLTDAPSHWPVARTRKVWVMLRGEDEKRKKVSIVNDMIIEWISKKRKILPSGKEEYPAPGTLNSLVRTFLAATKDYDWSFTLHDFKFDGGFNGFFKSMCKDRQKENPNYGVKGEGCQLSANEVEKIDLAFFDETDLMQHQMKVLFGCGLYAAFRGSQEHTQFSRSQVTFGNYPMDFEEEQLRGKRYVAITNFGSDKSHSLSVTNSYARTMGHNLRFPIDENDRGCFGASLERLLLKMAPGQVRIYSKEASDSYKASMAAKGYPQALMYANKPLGRNKVSELFAQGARMLDLPASFTPHSLRGACITKLVNDGRVSLAETMSVARHSSVSASKTYQRVDGVSESNRLRALGIMPTEAKEKKRRVIVELDENGKELSDTESTGSSPAVPSKPDPADFPLTQVYIEDLKKDIAEVQVLMAPQPPKKLTTNQKAIQELRKVVHDLKNKLQSRERDILYFRSMDHDRDGSLLRLRTELREVRRENARLRRENGEYSRFLFQSRTEEDI